MKQLIQTCLLDINESIRAKWFLVYSLVFGGLMVMLFAFGLTESRVTGFTGLSRLLITYIQLSMAIMPIFVLISTVRSLAGDKEAGVFEYLLSLPVSLSAWFWGKMIGRFFTVFIPVFVAMLPVIIIGGISGYDIPWKIFFFYTSFLISLSWCFLGLSMLISTLAKSVDVAQGFAFFLWLLLLLLLDLIFLGLIMQQTSMPNTVITIALLNPLQVFRTASMMLFDSQLVLIGPAAFLILDTFGNTMYLIWAIVYPFILGTISAVIGYITFKRGDLL
ncbi:MAG: ABC transporter permease [Gammaproteobacteria bacterium]|nr:MAG: ABC transporter permease [Gammaproteobacteria bacterium]